jgi:tRNA (cmo5U34)-methyltransferase
MSRDDPTETWTEGDSGEFLDLAPWIVPERDEQIATICALVPAQAPGSRIVELCCGSGALAAALLDRDPRATVLGLDGSTVMLRRAAAALARFGGRFTPQQFDLAARDWRTFAHPLQAVVSSLAIHHLDGEGKRQLFADLAAALAPGGVLVFADIVRPASAAAQLLAAAGWDEAVRASAARAGNPDAFARFQAGRWNYFADPDPDPMDQPSTLLEQLRWLEAAGLEAVDVYWMRAGHALFGGSKSGRRQQTS